MWILRSPPPFPLLKISSFDLIVSIFFLFFIERITLNSVDSRKIFTYSYPVGLVIAQ
ncbi:hypothetical protein Syun_011298 [Stephania yunnanensis]|uniref:Uncharacterized protein n=1 Tax=Stephania yunnanensis TaxID=152371 RepID=A0AAP0JX96_9MAGN